MTLRSLFILVQLCGIGMGRKTPDITFKYMWFVLEKNINRTKRDLTRL